MSSSTRNQLLFIPFSAMLLFGTVWAQEPGRQGNSAPNGVESEVRPASVMVRQGGVKDQMTAYLKEQTKAGNPMRTSLNKRAKDKGGDFFVAFGIGEISAYRSEKNWATSRAIAFDKAMNAAKGELLQFVVTEVEARMSEQTEENSAGITPAGEAESPKTVNAPATQPSLMDKIVQLSHMKVDAMIEKEREKSGKVTPTQPGGKEPVTKQQLSKLTRSEEFKNFVRTTSKAVIAGMQAFATFEDLKAGRNGEIGVIGIVSEKTLSLAAAVGSGSPLPKGEPKKSISEQIPDSTTEDGLRDLLYTFGVRTMYDESGDLVLVSFNQATPVNDSTGAEQTAQQRAGTFALGELRRFLGEQIARSEDAFRSQSVKDYEDNTRDTEAAEGGRTGYEALAEKIAITGIQSVDSGWTAKHPVTGHIICGSVKMWSPTGKAFATALRSKMAQAAAKAATDPGQNPRGVEGSDSRRKKIGDDQKGTGSGQGVSGDKNGF